MFGVRIWNVYIYATQPITGAYKGIYVMWATFTILTTRIYLNLVWLARQPILEETELSAPRFKAREVGGGHSTIITNEVITFGAQEMRPRRGASTLDSVRLLNFCILPLI